MPGKFTSYTIRILAHGGQTALEMNLICADDHDVSVGGPDHEPPLRDGNLGWRPPRRYASADERQGRLALA